MSGTVRVNEVFESIQGESSFAGLPCWFVRLAGCNLHCVYCDTPNAHDAGLDVSINELVDRAKASRSAIVEITGGEPLLQGGFVELATRLRDGTGKPVLVETNGSLDISMVPDHVVAIMDVKCPGSGAVDGIDVCNMTRLRAYDEVKFVLMHRADYEWAREFVRRCGLTSMPNRVFFSPVLDRLDARSLAGWIQEDGLAVRLQVQLHKWLGIP